MTLADFAEYLRSRRSELERYGSSVIDYVCSELGSDRNILKVAPIPRAKTIESALSKVVRKNYSDPIAQMTDIVGVRFVVLLHEDVERVSQIIAAGPWEARQDRDYENEKLAAPTTFAYQSNHFIVYTKDNDFAHGSGVSVGTPCEVQIRTLLQHAYGELTHDTIYKPGGLRPPPSAERLVARSMALIESTDDYFMKTTEELRFAELPGKSWYKALLDLYKEVIGPDTAHPVESLNIEFHTLVSEVAAIATIEPLMAYWRDPESQGFVECIRRRAGEAFLFQQPLILALYFGLPRAQLVLTQRWPFESLNAELDEVYADLGIPRNHH